MNPSRFRLTCLLLLLAPLRGLPAEKAPAPAAAYPLEAYSAVGSDFARDTCLAGLGWDEKQLGAFLEGVRATFRGQPYLLDKRAQQLQVEIATRLVALRSKAEQARLDFSQPGRLQTYMKDVTKQYALQLSDSGLAYALMPRQDGFRPGPDDTVVVTCEAVAADQQTELPQISAKHQRCKVATLLPGLAEGVQMLTPGGRALLVLPPDLSYGTGEWPAGVERGAPILFTVTLHEIVAQP